VRRFGYAAVAFLLILVALHFPYDTDATTIEPRPAKSFYEAVYRPDGQETRGLDYERTAAEAAKSFDIEGRVKSFVTQYSLRDKRVLDVGSGRGYLQDIVADYTGIDLSSKVAPYYHKPFVAASATEMPFRNDTFDAAWSVWVVEHIPQPQKAFEEMRRVVKPGGLLFLIVAWNCTPWAADGFEVRPYSDFNWRGKAIKASISVRQTLAFDFLHRIPTRAIRWGQYRFAGARTPLHFSALQANYDIYWQPDSDAAVSLDRFESLQWFRSRGDECLNCGASREILDYNDPLIIRVHKD
jgi:SAM-dependent methyltransferase